MMTQGPFRLLHVGCGRKTRADLVPPFNQAPWEEIRLDIDPAAEPDIVASITDMGMIADGSVQALWSAHNLEHLHPHEAEAALAEFRRVLVPDGFAVITTPDLQMIAEAIARGGLTDTAYVAPAGPVAPIDMLYGFRPALAAGQMQMAHRTGFTAATLETALLRAGFAAAAVRPDKFWAIWAVASRSGEDTRRVGELAEDLARRAYPAVA
jgi:SAM-dependent methyltransferase